MRGIESDNLLLAGVEIRLLFSSLFVELGEPKRVTRLPPGWVEEVEEQVTRVFHPRYQEVMSPVRRVVCCACKIKGLDTHSFRSIPWPQGTVSRSRFEQLLDEKGAVLEDIDFRPVVYIYPEGVVIFEIALHLKEELDVSHLVALINAVLDFDAQLNLTNGDRVTVFQVVTRTAEELVQKEVSKESFFERFSVINATSLKPALANSEDYFQDPYFKDLSGIAIRRALQYQDIRPSLLKPVHNLALYSSDVVTLTYHNMLCVVHGQLPLDFYLSIVRALKAMTTMLQHYDIEAYRRIKQIRSFPKRIRRVRKQIRELEELRLGITRSLDAYRMLTSVSATRARMILNEGLEVFSIRNLVADLRDSMGEIDELLSREYNVRLQRTLQWFAIIVALFTLFTAVVQVVGAEKFRFFIRSVAGFFRALVSSWFP